MWNCDEERIQEVFVAAVLIATYMYCITVTSCNINFAWKKFLWFTRDVHRMTGYLQGCLVLQALLVLLILHYFLEIPIIQMKFVNAKVKRLIISPFLSCAISQFIYKSTPNIPILQYKLLPVLELTTTKTKALNLAPRKILYFYKIVHALQWNPINTTTNGPK